MSYAMQGSLSRSGGYQPQGDPKVGQHYWIDPGVYKVPEAFIVSIKRYLENVHCCRFSLLQLKLTFYTQTFTYVVGLHFCLVIKFLLTYFIPWITFLFNNESKKNATHNIQKSFLFKYFKQKIKRTVPLILFFFTVGSAYSLDTLCIGLL